MAYADLSPAEKRKYTMDSKKKAEEIRHLWYQSDTGNRQKWHQKEQQCYDFFLNDQLTEEEIETLEEAGMPTFIINRVTPVIETMKYLITANRPSWKAVGKDGADSRMAQIETDVIEYALSNSGGKALISKVVRSALTKSKGYIHVYVDPDADNGLGEVMFEYVDPFHVWVSNMACDEFERDMTYQMIKKDLPREFLVEQMPGFADTIKKAKGERDSSRFYSEKDFEVSDSIQFPDLEEPVQKDGQEDDVLPYYEMYFPKKKKYYNVTIRVEANEEELVGVRDRMEQDLELFKKEQDVLIQERANELNALVATDQMVPDRAKLELQKAKVEADRALEDRRQLIMGAIQKESSKTEQKIISEEEYEILKNRVEILDYVEFYKPRIHKRCCVGDRFLYEKELPLTFSPLIPLPYMHTDSPFPMSAVRPLIGKQQEINKSHQVMVHNANLSSNLRWMYVEGEIDEEVWEKYSSSASALLPYRQGYSANGPREIMPQNINNAFFTIEHESKSDLEFMAGIMPASMGVSSGGDETYRGFLAKDEYGSRRTKAWVSDVFEPWLEHVGRVFQEYAKDVYTVHKVMRIAQPNPDGQLTHKEFEINAPVYDNVGKEVGRWNDYATARYDLKIVAGSTLPVNRWALLEEYKQYLQLGVIDDIAMLIQTDIPDKDAIIERKSIYAQQQSAIESLEDKIKQLEGDNDTLKRQLIQSGIKMKVQDAMMEIDRSKSETKMADKLFQERLRDELKMARGDFEQLLAELSSSNSLKKQDNNTNNTKENA